MWKTSGLGHAPRVTRTDASYHKLMTLALVESELEGVCCSMPSNKGSTSKALLPCAACSRPLRSRLSGSKIIRESGIAGMAVAITEQERAVPSLDERVTREDIDSVRPMRKLRRTRVVRVERDVCAVHTSMPPSAWQLPRDLVILSHHHILGTWFLSVILYRRNRTE